MLADPLGRRMLAAMDARELQSMAQAIAADDPYWENGFLARALRLAGADGTEVREVIEHQLWCTWRQARWATKKLTREDLGQSLEVTGREWIAETIGKPTILIAPMTLCTWDAVESVQHFARRECGDREILFYGEDMGSHDARFVAGDDITVLRRISRTLAEGGVFCTYPDFVYRGHPVLPVRMFGVPRPMSSGFAYLAARPGVHLLPCLLLRQGETIHAEICEPILLEDNSEPGGPSFQSLTAQVVASTLEELIRRAPSQWLLLPTLSFDAPEMAHPPETTQGAA